LYTIFFKYIYNLLASIVVSPDLIREKMSKPKIGIGMLRYILYRYILVIYLLIREFDLDYIGYTKWTFNCGSENSYKLA